MVNGGRYPRVSCGVDSEPHNGHITQSGNAFINKGERQNWASMSIAKSPEKSKGVKEGQTAQIYMENKGSSDIDTEGDREVFRPLENDHPHRADMPTLKKCGVNLQSGQHYVKEDIGEMGQKLKGPIKSATKVYVRRKEVLLSNGKAQYLQGPSVESDPVPKTDCMPTIQGDKIEKKCALVREMGLSFGGDDMKIKEIMLDMDKRDNMVTTEMGIKKQII